MKDIVTAIEKESEYIQEKVFNENRHANIYDYIAQGGYDNLNEYFRDKFYYSIVKCNMTSVTDSATVLQPLAYQYYQDGTPFCFFVEYDKPFALVPMSFDDEEKFAEYDLDCFKCGYEDGGIIVTHQDDFRFCISIPQTDNCSEKLVLRIYEFLKGYYPDLILDGNDFMYDDKKVAGAVHFDYNGMCIFAINVSIIDMSELIEKIGIKKVKQPGCLPYIEGMKNILKTEVEQWLRKL